jgi:predicted transcriptional regulator
MTLREMIDRKGLRHKWVAGQLGISTSYLSYILSGDRPCPDKIIPQLAGLLDVTLPQVWRAAKNTERNTK